jgi:glutathione S-transferase
MAQRWVPVLVNGDDVIHESHPILEYLDHVITAEKTGAA